MVHVDTNQIEHFVNNLFQLPAPDDCFVSLRGFDEHNASSKPAIAQVYRPTPERIIQGVVPFAEQQASRPDPFNCAPPIAYFRDPEKGYRATRDTLAAGVCISIEIDHALEEGLAAVEAVIGPASVVLHSGGTHDGRPKGHAHWRLSALATGDDLDKLTRARKLATQLAGGDATSVNPVHPMRWPGTVHRKGTPLLAQLVRNDPDACVDLNVALAALEAAVPGIPEANASATSGKSDEDLLIDIRTGTNIHQSLCALAFRFLMGGTKPEAVVRRLEGIMDASAVKDARWETRRKEIPALVDSGQVKVRAQTVEKIDAMLEQKAEAETILAAIARMPAIGVAQEDRTLRALNARDGTGLTVLRNMLKSARRDARDENPAQLPAPEVLARLYRSTQQQTLRTADGSFWTYNGRFWERLGDDAVLADLQALVAQYRYLFTTDMGPMESTRLCDLAIKALGRSVQTSGDIMRLTEPSAAVINCLNGELWLTDAGPELRPHKANSYLTSCAPTEWDPEAVAPCFMRIVRGFFADQGGAAWPDADDMVRHLLEILGYAIQTDRSLKAFLLLYGPGDNGKSLLIDIIRHLIGTEAMFFVPLKDLERDPFAVASLVGKQMLVDDDVAKDSVLPDGLIKKISERKPLNGQHKFKDRFSFIAEVLPVMLCNNLPHLRDTSHGITTRALVVPMPRVFYSGSDLPPERQADRKRPDLKAKVIAKELPGVLRILVEAYYDLRQRGAFKIPQRCHDAHHHWLTTTQPVVRFCDECITPGDGATLEAVFRKFTYWAVDEGINGRYLPTRNTFSDRLRDLGFSVVRRNTGMWVENITVEYTSTCITLGVYGGGTCT